MRFRLSGGRDRVGARGAGPEDFYGHAGAEVGNVGAVELGYYVVTVAGGVNGGTNFHDARGERTAGIFDEREFDGGAWRGAAA